MKKMKNKGKTKTVAVVYLLSVMLLSFGYSLEYRFERKWPELPQPWYFYGPCGIAVDKITGNVYIADTSNHRIQVFTSTGGFITNWGSEGSADGQFKEPYGVAVDSSGNVYVADTDNHRIQVFTSTGGFITKWGSYGIADGQFRSPSGVAVDSLGRVYVADSWNHRIQVFTSTGGFIRKWGSYGSADGWFRAPLGVAVDSSGNVYIADALNHRIQVFTPTSGFIRNWGSLGSADGQFSYPSGVAVDNSGNVYVADRGNNRIQKFVRVGEIPPQEYGTIAGKVTKSDGTTPIQGVLIEVLSGGNVVKQTTTDTYGNYSLSVLAGSYEVRASKSGFQPQSKQVTVGVGERKEVNFVLVEVLLPTVLGEGNIKIVVSEGMGEKGTINPDKGGKAYIYFKGDKVGKFTCKIFTLLGELIYEETKHDMREGFFEWIPKDIASGTYIVYVEGPGVKIHRKVVILR